MSQLYHFPGTEVMLMSQEEFLSLPGDYPYRHNLRKSLSPIHYCKIEIFKGCIQGTMKIPRYHKNVLKNHTFGFYLLKDQMILIGAEDFLPTVLGKVAETAGDELHPNQILLLLLETLISEDVLHLLRQEEQLTAIEENLLHNIPADFYETIIRYQKQFSAYHAYYEQMMNMGDMMQADICHLLSGDEPAAWQLFSNRSQRLHDHVELLREYLVQLRDLYMAQNDKRQNKALNFLTVVTAIFLPLSLITGWYGMNFAHMPELAYKYSYPVVICISIIILLLEIIFLRRKKIL